MNHSERIAYTARQHHHLTRNNVRDAIDTYLAQLAEDIASGEWIEIPNIGKIQVLEEQGTGIVFLINKNKERIPHSVTKRLRVKFRLAHSFKQLCYSTQGKQPLE